MMNDWDTFMGHPNRIYIFVLMTYTQFKHPYASRRRNIIGNKSRAQVRNTKWPEKIENNKTKS